MNKKIYDLMDWAGIEEIVYGEAASPQMLLGPHTIGRQTLVQAFFPEAQKVSLCVKGPEGPKGKTVKEEIPMELVDEAGYFAVLLPGKNRRDYFYEVTYASTGRKKNKKQMQDPYLYTNLVTEEMAAEFLAGTATKAYELLGSHCMTMEGVRGCRFLVWAPNAVRVSVVGDFNQWNSKSHQMMASNAPGLFEIFLPGVEEGEIYKYEILTKGSGAQLKADPYALAQEENGADASMIYGQPSFKWQDDKFLAARKKNDARKMPYLALEIYLGAFISEKNPTLKKATADIVNYAKKMHYTHVELMPFMACEKEETAGYFVNQFYAVDAKYGSPADYKYLVNELHKAGIGVIMQYPVGSFASSESGLTRFDGTGLYEYEDHRRGVDPRNGKLLFQFGRNEVRSYLLSNLWYYFEEFHMDGFKFCDLSSVLYLDYYRPQGEWIPNMYGGNENLEAIDFMKEINARLHKDFPGVLTIAEEESAWPNITTYSNKDKARGDAFETLGFDFALDLGFNKDVLEYLHADPILRRHLHDNLTLSSVYQYNENYIIPITHDNAGFGRGGLIAQMPGTLKDKISNLKLLFAYQMLRTGKKQTFMGQDFGVEDAFQAWMKLDLSVASLEGHKQLMTYCADLNAFYLANPFLYEMDLEEDGFAWLNQISAEENVLSFVRRGKKKGEDYTVILNFANTSYARYRFGCSQLGEYQEIFCSDEVKYFGEGRVNGKILPTREEAYDGRAYSFCMNLAPLSVTVLSFKPYTEAQKKEIARKKALREKKQEERECARRELIREQEEKYALLAKEKEQIRAELLEELERRYKEAERRILG